MQQPAFTVTASHPLIWCTRDGATVRCLTVAESALLMGFPPGWQLPRGSRAGLRAVGNAVPPPLAEAVMACAARAAGQAACAQAPNTASPKVLALPEPAARPAEEQPVGPAQGGGGSYEELAALRRKLRRLARRVVALEAAVGE